MRGLECEIKCIAASDMLWRCLIVASVWVITHAQAPLYALQTTAMCGENGTSHITTPTECQMAGYYLALPGAYHIYILPESATDSHTYGCAFSQFMHESGLGNAVRFNIGGKTDGNGTDVTNMIAVKSICRTAGGAAGTDYALGLHNTTTTCETGRAVTTYDECLHAAVKFRGVEITTTSGINSFKADLFDSNGLGTGDVGGVCYHSFDDNKADGSYRYTDGKFHFNANTTVATELMSAVCAVQKKEELCAADGDFVEGTVGNAICPEGTVTIDTPNECMLAAKTTLKLIPYGSPMNGDGVRAMDTRLTSIGSNLQTLPNCSYNKGRADYTNINNYALLNFNSNYDDAGNAMSGKFAPLCRCEAPPPPPPPGPGPGPGPGPIQVAMQVISTTTAGGSTTDAKDSTPSTVIIIIIIIVSVLAVGGIAFLIYINPEWFRQWNRNADMNVQML